MDPELDEYRKRIVVRIWIAKIFFVMISIVGLMLVAIASSSGLDRLLVLYIVSLMVLSKLGFNLIRYLEKKYLY